jgi:hypothetical protein
MPSPIGAVVILARFELSFIESGQSAIHLFAAGQAFVVVVVGGFLWGEGGWKGGGDGGRKGIYQQRVSETASPRRAREKKVSVKTKCP